MLSEQLPGEAYQLAAEYQLGEPIRVYGTNKRWEIKTSIWVIIALTLIVELTMYFQNGFRLETISLFIYGICGFIGVTVTLIAVISILGAPNMTVYICASGFIVVTRSSSEAVRWESVERVAARTGDAYSPYIVYLTDPGRPDITLGKYLTGLKELTEEIELKAQLARDPEQSLDIENQYERAKNAQLERQQAGELLYQNHRQYLATKDPEEASRLGAEYRLGKTLGTYHSGFRGLPQKATLKSLAWTLVFMVVPVFNPQDGIKPFWPTGCLVAIALFALFFIVPRVFSRNVRLHIYSEGFIFIHSSLDIVRWDQIEKVVYATGLFLGFCTFHLKNGEKLALSAHLEKQSEIKQVLDPKIQRKEMHSVKKGKIEYIDIGHLAD